MDWETFTIGFWHPFGDHGAHPDGRIETADEILQRKSLEIASTGGWTLWSFQYRRDLDELVKVLEQVNSGRVYALCSDSRSTVAPSGEVRRCRQYRPARTNEWQDIPNTISIPHPFGKREYACAFKIRQIIELSGQDQCPAIDIEWYSTRTKQWSTIFRTRNDPQRKGYPPRPEMLIRLSHDGVPLRPVRAVLELAPPFLATLRV